MKFRFLIPIMSLGFISGCTKAKSERWMVADVTAFDYYTNQPIHFTAKMKYTDGSGFVTTYETKTLGFSDENGNIKIEERIGRKTVGHKLQLFTDTYYNRPYSGPDGPMPAYETKMDRKGANKMTLYLKQYRLFNVHLVNTNCFGPTDTLWINALNGKITSTKVYTGCQNSTFPYGGQDNNYTQDQSVTFHLVTKKNGITTISDQSFNLTPGVNDIEIDY